MNKSKIGFGKKKGYVVLFALFFSLVTGTGCSKRYDDLPAFIAFPFNDSYNYSVGRFKTSYLADQIHAYYRGNTSGPIAIATFVNIDNLYGSSSFGRLLAEQLMSELSMKGYNVVELRQAEAMQVMFDQGEFALSRDISTLRNKQDLAGIVVGTYTVSPVRVYLNVRLIDPISSMAISAGSVEMAKTDEIDRMLRQNTLPSTLERVPVRHLGYSFQPTPYYYGPNYAPYYMPPTNFGPRKRREYSEDDTPAAAPRPDTEENAPPAKSPEAHLGS